MCLESTHIWRVLFFFGTKTTLASHSEWYTSRMNATPNSCAISSPIALRFSAADHRRYSLTGFTVESTQSLCSASSLETPGLPCEDVPVLMKELDELDFLIVVKGAGDVGRGSIQVFGMDVHGLHLPRCLESRFHSFLLRFQQLA